MPRAAWASSRDPFRPRKAAAFPFPSAAFERARVDSTASLARGVPRIAIVGAAGTGKSVLLAEIARDLAAAGEIAWLQPPATELPVAATLLVDEFDRLDPETRAALRARPPGTRLVVAGLEDPDPTDDTVRVVLTSLEPYETDLYIQHRLRSADLPTDLFDPAAVARLANAAQRVPRVLDALAGRALFAATLDEADRVTDLHARQAIEEHAALLALDAERPTTAAAMAAEPVAGDTAVVLAAAAAAGEEAPQEQSTADAQLQPQRQVVPGPQPSAPLIAKRIWPEAASAPARNRRVQVSAPMLVFTAAACFALGAVLVVAARASVANEPMLAALHVPALPPPPLPLPPTARTEAAASRPAGLAPASLPVPITTTQPQPQAQTQPQTQAEPGSPHVVVQYGRADEESARDAEAIATRLRARGYQTELHPLDLRINKASVRYFFDADRTRSQVLEREVNAFVRETGLARSSDLLPMRYYEPKPRRGTVEVWLPSR
jgi:hypothetical protein